MNEKPIMGLKNKTDFLNANKNRITRIRPRTSKKEVRYKNKKTFGKIPNYLKKIIKY